VDVQGSVAQGGSTSYLVKASAKQFMMVILSSANQALVLQIQAPDGSIMSSNVYRPAITQRTIPSRLLLFNGVVAPR
jgi:hypothetical protein